MTRKTYIFTLLTALCILHGAVSAQVYPNTPVTVSSDKLRVDGKLYYAHPVLERQTLFSISKAYGVTMDEIIAANPELDIKTNGIKMGQILHIPDNGQLTATPAEAKPEAKPETNNPKEETDPQKRESGTEFIIYEVRWFDDLGSIARKYGVDKESIMAFNGMKSEKLSKRQKLKIPQGKVGAPAAETTVTDAIEAAGQAVQDGIITLDSLFQDAGHRISRLFHRKKDVIGITVILPFDAKGKSDASSFDLYSGMLLAAKDLSDAGIATDIKVIDSKKPGTPIQAEDIDGADMVFGPISPEDIEAVLALSGGNTAVISPLDHRVNNMLSSHPDLIQAPSNSSDQFDDIINWIRQDLEPGDHVLLISEKGVAPTAIASRLKASGIGYSSFSYDILEGRNVSLERFMSQTGVTRAVIASEKEAFVNDAVRNLNLMIHKKFNVVLYGPSKIRNYETIDIESLHNVSAHISSSYFVNYDSAKTKGFLLAYRALFGTEPTPFAYQGYDIFNYFVSCYDNYGEKWVEKMESSEEIGLQSAFRITQSEDGGYSNSAVRRAIYEPDFTIRVIR